MTQKTRTFLSAEWRNLIFINYEIDPAILQKYIPYGVELDTFNGQHLISLVGFQFLNTQLLRYSIPFHRNFEEVNLRFYVIRKVNGAWRRGVVFIKEIVPLRAVSFIANQVFKEHYVTRKMAHYLDKDHQKIGLGYSWTEGRNMQTLCVLADNEPELFLEGSKENFITEHYWGYVQVNPKESNEYEVNHPQWHCYPILDWEVDVDYGLVYGSDFNVLNNSLPDTVMLADGSNITTATYQKINKSLT